MSESSQPDPVVFSSRSAADWTNGRWEGAPPENIRGVFTDTRTVVAGALFIALRGPTFDGHAYAAAAVSAGACAVMADNRASLPPGLPVLRVADTREGLRALASGWRDRLSGRVVGITGSAGKTTVKTWTAHLLAASGTTACTPGNWNNDLGVPKSLLTVPESAAFAVLEAGTNHPGEIHPLASLIRPECVILTNIGPSHIAFFGSEAAIAHEKADLLRVLPPDGRAVLDADSAHFDWLAAQTPCPVITVSVSTDADYRAQDVDGEAGAFTVVERATGDRRLIETGQPGAHHVVNALQALAVARYFGVPWPSITSRFQSLPRMPMRWERMERGSTVWINDAYNANPLSMTRALETFAALDTRGGIKIAVLGDMYELGSDEQRLHAEVGRVAARCGLHTLLAVGPRASTWLADAAVDAGMDETQVFRAASLEAAREHADRLRVPGAHVLLKASRGMALERIMG